MTTERSLDQLSISDRLRLHSEDPGLPGLTLEQCIENVNKAIDGYRGTLSKGAVEFLLPEVLWISRQTIGELERELREKEVILRPGGRKKLHAYDRDSVLALAASAWVVDEMYRQDDGPFEMTIGELALNAKAQLVDFPEIESRVVVPEDSEQPFSFGKKTRDRIYGTRSRSSLEDEMTENADFLLELISDEMLEAAKSWDARRISRLLLVLPSDLLNNVRFSPDEIPEHIAVIIMTTYKKIKGSEFDYDPTEGMSALELGQAADYCIDLIEVSNGRHGSNLAELFMLVNGSSDRRL